MSLLSIRSKYSNKILFSGRFKTQRAAVEDAVAQGVDLSFVDLRGADLRDANLDDGLFAQADFTHANLSGANLSQSVLNGALLSNALLYNTCLAYSDLHGARFDYTFFGGTDITGADLRDAVFAGRSCFCVPFITAADLKGATYRCDDGTVRGLSRPPLVIHGVTPQPMAIFQDKIMVRTQSKKTQRLA